MLNPLTKSPQELNHFYTIRICNNIISSWQGPGVWIFFSVPPREEQKRAVEKYTSSMLETTDPQERIVNSGTHHLLSSFSSLLLFFPVPPVKYCRRRRGNGSDRGRGSGLRMEFVHHRDTLASCSPRQNLLTVNLYTVYINIYSWPLNNVRVRGTNSPHPAEKSTYNFWLTQNFTTNSLTTKP